MKIIEIFKSIQGEGRDQGKICSFVRLGGCNLRCAWCDTPYAWDEGNDTEIPEIIAELQHLGSDLVCITGGEPLLQAEEVNTLVQALHASGYGVSIETNGTRDFSVLQPYARVCMDVKCPSSGEASDLALLDHITRRDDVKFVVQDGEDLAYMEQILHDRQIRGEVIVTPVFGSDLRKSAEYILDHDLPVRFQVQLHRIIGVR